MKLSRNQLLAGLALAAPLGLCLVGLAIRLSDWPAHQAAREVAAAERRAQEIEGLWRGWLSRWGGDDRLAALTAGSPAPFARLGAVGAEQDAHGAILTELVTAGRYEAALEFRAAMTRDRPETPVMRWALARAYAGLGRTAEAVEVADGILERRDDPEISTAQVDGLPLLGLVARWRIRWAVEADDRETAVALRDGIVAGLTPVPAFAAAGLLEDWDRAGVGLDRAAASSWRAAAAQVASGDDPPEAWTRAGRTLWIPRPDGGLVAVPEVEWAAAFVQLRRPRPDGYYLASDENPRRLSTVELQGLDRFAVKHRGTRDSALLDGLSWVLILVGGLGTVGGAWLSWRVARREVALLRMRQAFVDQVSHDLRTPLTALMVKTELLATGQLPEHKVASYQRSVHREATRLAEVVHSVLDFARLERAGVPIPLGPVAARDVLAEAFRGSREILEAQGCRVSLDVGKDLPPLAANRPLLVRALRNLLENAAHHAPGSEVSVTARPLDDERLELVVADRGPGLGVTDPRVLFEPGRRGPAGDTASGHGLGLSVVAQAVAAHGGEVHAADRDGGGAAFRIVLPVEREAA